MRQVIRLARYAAMLAALAGPPLAATAQPQAVARQADRQADRQAEALVDLSALFDAVVGAIEKNFVDESLLKSLDWQGRAAAVRPSVMSAATPQEAVDAVNRLLGELKTSHTGLYTPDDYRYYITLDALLGAPGTSRLVAGKFWGSGPYYPGTGIFTRMEEGRHFVDGVLEGSPADRAGLKYGDEIVGVDGEPYNPVAAFRGKIGTAAELEFRRERGGETVRVKVDVVPIVPSSAFAAATRASARVIERNGRRIGYVHLWSTNEMRSFRAALASLDPVYFGPLATTDHAKVNGGRRLDALIVDLRGRVGGNIGSASQLLDMLGTAPKPYWGQRRTLDRQGRDSAPASEPFVTRPPSPPVRPFAGPTALLVDRQTRSASEVMAHGYKRSRLGTVIGTTTAGAVSGGIPMAMPGGLLLYVAGSLSAFDGKPLEGVGVEPDVRVEQPLAYAVGADPVLEAAIDHLATAEAAK